MNRNALIILGVGGLVAYVLWTRLSPAIAARPAVAGGTTPINSARTTTKSGQLQNQLLQLGAGWAANWLHGSRVDARVTGENGGGAIPSESTAGSSPSSTSTTASTSD